VVEDFVTTIGSKIRPDKYQKTCVPVFSSDDADLLAFKWSSNPQGYPYRIVTAGGRQLHIYAHKEVCPRFLGRNSDRSKGELTDHINRNPMDNRRENLRIVSFSQNCTNSERVLNAKGYYRQDDFWRSRIRINNKLICLGCFDTKEEARAAYLEAVQIREKSYYK
jgi:hypothetical protein